MTKPQAPGMQQQAIATWFRRLGRPVDRIPQDRMANLLEMHPQLVGAAGTGHKQ